MRCGLARRLHRALTRWRLIARWILDRRLRLSDVESKNPLEVCRIAGGECPDDRVMLAGRLLDARPRSPLIGRCRGDAAAQLGHQIDELAIAAQAEQRAVKGEVRLVLLED